MLACYFYFTTTKKSLHGERKNMSLRVIGFAAMRKVFKKILGVIAATLLLVSLIVAVRPLFSVITLSFCQGENCEAPDTGEIAGVDLPDDTLGLVPQVNKTAFFWSIQRMLSSATLIVDRTIGDDARQTIARNEDYLLYNDLHFNTPPVTSRQPESENSSASDA